MVQKHIVFFIGNLLERPFNENRYLCCFLILKKGVEPICREPKLHGKRMFSRCWKVG